MPVFFLSAGAIALIAHRRMPALDVLSAFLPQAATIAVAILLGALMRSRAAGRRRGAAAGDARVGDRRGARRRAGPRRR
ncbi:hypothetical protein GCM10009827_108620 [Dactylosporangium maewongense]|uniref:Uncharacterized protein n=1 Tax=Dactylosporangium maewongense TaxID=634393 RepID=A0ABN2D2G7_9ACTN